MIDNLPAGLNLDYTELQQFQDVFSQTTRLFIFCMANDGEGINRVTDVSGDPVEVERLLGLLRTEQIEAAVLRVLGSSLEEQVIDDTEYPNVKIAAIGVKIGENPVFCWFVCGVLHDDKLNRDTGLKSGWHNLNSADNENAVKNFHTTVSEADFYRSIDLLRSVSKRMYTYPYDNMIKIAADKAERVTDSGNISSGSEKRFKFMAKVVQTLDSDEPFDDIASRVVTDAAKYSDISNAYLIKFVTVNSVELLVRYEKPGESDLSGELLNIPVNVLHSLCDKPAVISCNTRIEEDNRKWLDEIGITSLVTLPILHNRQPIMCIFFADSSEGRRWDIEDTKLFSDSVKVLQSILIRRLQKNSLTSSYKSLESILDNVGSSIYVRDLETRKILFANRMCYATFGKEMRNGKLERLFEPEVKNSAVTYLEVAYPEKNRFYDLNTTFIQWVDGRQVCLNSIFDVTDKKIYQQTIERQANNDFLTGLYNRMCCEKDLTRYIDEAKSKGERGAIIYLDLDDFKHINDGLGHQYGDMLLKAISTELKRIDGIESTCYRMGGDEFVIIVPCASYSKFEKIKDELQILFNKPWFLKGADYYCTSSIGIVTFPDDGDTVSDLIKKADVAMYQSKNSGKNKTSEYSKDADSDDAKRLDMEKSMRQAAAEGLSEFEIYYQPIIDIRKQGSPCVGAEALLRWNSTDLGFVSPGEFIPLAEYLGLINPIGNFVLMKACEELKFWNETGHPYYKVNVNLSVVQLLQNDIAETIKDIIDKTKINPKNLTLEVTESLAINDMARMKKILMNIKQLGVKIALDDFGTGYSSLNRIRELPIDVIKVDQAFVTNLASDDYAQSFIAMIGSLAKALKVKICIEGIETNEQYKVIENMNIHMIQGYYFDKPMKKEEFEKKYVLIPE